MQGVIQEFIVPEIHQVVAEVRTLRVENRRLDGKIHLVRSEPKAEMDSLRKEMEAPSVAFRRE